MSNSVFRLKNTFGEKLAKARCGYAIEHSAIIPPSFAFGFVGPRGVAKTSAAALLAREYYRRGLLPKNKLVFPDLPDDTPEALALIERFVDLAQGGVLLLDNPFDRPDLEMLLPAIRQAIASAGQGKMAAVIESVPVGDWRIFGHYLGVEPKLVLFGELTDPEICTAVRHLGQERGLREAVTETLVRRALSERRACGLSGLPFGGLHRLLELVDAAARGEVVSPLAVGMGDTASYRGWLAEMLEELTPEQRRQRLITLKTARGLTGSQIGDLAGVSTSTARAWLRTPGTPGHRKISAGVLANIEAGFSL
jgi:hypothetical protein